MTSTVLAALILGACAGMAPGPYTTMVVATALERGFRPAARLALTPLVTDIGPLVTTALLLDVLDPRALTVIGVLGGLTVAVIGVRFLSHHRRPPEELEPKVPRQSAGFWHVVLSAVLSPAPWLFWLVVGSPLLLRSWGRSPEEGVLFVVLLFATNIGTASALAWGASHGRRIMSRPWRRWALRLTGVGLTLAGGVLVWQSLVGNFQAMVDRQEDLRTFVEEQTSGS
ncbi:MAG TPA: LysE family transporter [Longimicrobiales bacterium]|nr:LysE family transporter [Longimicrobiales bacterium]